MSRGSNRPARFALTFGVDIAADLAALSEIGTEELDAERRPQRFRLVYRPVDATTLDVIAIGVRDEHAICRTAVRRITSRT